MGILGFRGLTIGLAAAILAACGAQSTSMLPQSNGAQSRAHMASSGNALLYVVTGDATVMLSYPGYESVGSLNPQGYLGFPCSDPVTGDVYMDTGSEVRQYTYGATNLSATVFLNNDEGSFGCAVDPTNSNLAVIGSSKSGAAVFVYANVNGNPAKYTEPRLKAFYYGGYDNNGNLFVDGLTNDSQFVFAELAKGQSKFTTIALNKKFVNSPGNVQFDGSDSTIKSGLSIYRVQVSGSSGTIVGKTTLNRSWSLPPSSTIFNGTVIAAQGGGHHPGHGVAFWHYPDGGKPFLILTSVSQNKKDVIDGTTVAVAPSH